MSVSRKMHRTRLDRLPAPLAMLALGLALSLAPAVGVPADAPATAHGPAAQPATPPATPPTAAPAATPARPAAPQAAPHAPSVAATSSAAPADSGMILKGGQEGTALRSLTVEGEDRVQFEFERPALVLDLDATRAPGLDWGDAKDVLERTPTDPVEPLLAASARESCPYLGRPWLSQLATGPVARFRPQVQGVERWQLMVADSRGGTVAQFSAKGKPPAEITWDGRSLDGKPASPGLTYSYVFEAYDRAGNKRNFVGQGFELPAYRFSSPQGQTILFSGKLLTGVMPLRGAGGAAAARGASAGKPAPLVLEVASWVNQVDPARPVTVSATARSFDQANAMAGSVAEGMKPYLLGDPARVRVLTDVQTDAPPDGSLQVAF